MEYAQYVIYYRGKIGILYKSHLSSVIEFDNGYYFACELAPISELEKCIIGVF